MTLFQEFKLLFPYLVSIRRLKTYLSFDINFPLGWKLPKKYVDENSVVENQTDEADVRFLSFVTQFDEDGIKKTLESIKNIIKYNKEREEKEKLFQDKVNELKTLFEGQSLEALKNLVFDIDKLKNIELDDTEETRPVEVVSKRGNKRQGGNPQVQESND
jgi:hypothetical protein